MSHDSQQDAATLRQQAGRVDEDEDLKYRLETAEAYGRQCDDDMRALLDRAEKSEAALAQNTQGDGEAVAWLCDAPDDGVRTAVIAKALADMCERNGWTVQPLHLAAAPSQRAEVKL